MGNIICNEWVLQPTFTFGLDAAQIGVANVTADVANVAAQVIEAGLIAVDAQEVPGTTCEFTTKAFSLVALGDHDSTANTIQVDIDWTVLQELCGTEGATHGVLKNADYTNIVLLFNQFGVSSSNQFLSAVTDLRYACPRDAQCDGC